MAQNHSKPSEDGIRTENPGDTTEASFKITLGKAAMKYDFSAQFLRRENQDMNFGEAWESLCFDLLRAELKDQSLMRLSPPDLGVDILSRTLREAFQCKSDERGAGGSLSGADSIVSLQRAVKNKTSLRWDKYSFCTNARYTGNALKQITEKAAELSLDAAHLDFKGPEYWDELCERHFSLVQNRFDYRVTASEKRVIEALKAAGYFEKYVQEYQEKIKSGGFRIVVKNNRTPVELEFPFSNELSVENCLDVVRELLGVSLQWTNFADLGTSTGPSISLSVGQKAQGFSQKIKDLPLSASNELTFWITVVWEDETRKDGDSSEYRLMLEPMTVNTNAVSYDERRILTVKRGEEILQGMIWTAARRLKSEEMLAASTSLG